MIQTILFFICFYGCLATDPTIWSSRSPVNDFPSGIPNINIPSGRGAATAVVIKDRIYLGFGFNESITGSGIGQSENTFYNDFYELNPNSGRYNLLNINGTRPDPRAFACGIVAPNGKSIIYFMHLMTCGDWT